MKCRISVDICLSTHRARHGPCEEIGKWIIFCLVTGRADTQSNCKGKPGWGGGGGGVGGSTVRLTYSACGTHLQTIGGCMSSMW